MRKYSKRERATVNESISCPLPLGTNVLCRWSQELSEVVAHIYVRSTNTVMLLIVGIEPSLVCRLHALPFCSARFGSFLQ